MAPAQGWHAKIEMKFLPFWIEIEQESDILIADYSFDECSFFKDDDDDMCA